MRIIPMNFEQAKELSFLVPWKTSECFSGPDCWCRIILPVEPIYYSHPENPENKHEYTIVDAGALDQETAEYIVKIHNNRLEIDKTITNSIQQIVSQPLDKDYGDSQ